MPAPVSKWTPPTPATAGNEELAVTTPVGSFKFSGSQMFPVILVLLLSAVFFYLFYASDTKAGESAKAGVVAIQEVKVANTLALEKVMESNVKTEKTLRVLTYVLSLTQAERERLGLMKPKELQEMQR